MEKKAFRNLGWSLIGVSIGALIILIFLSGMLSEEIVDINDRLVTLLSILISVLLAIGITCLSIYYTSGKWYDVFERFEKDLGIYNANHKRRGREADRNLEWIEFLEQAKKKIILIGTTQGGWFVRGFNLVIDRLPSILSRLEKKNGGFST